jgi:hypothetical protein
MMTTAIRPLCMQAAGAAALWDGTGSLIFTSSMGVYAVDSGPCLEESRLVEVGSSERTDRLLNAEAAILSVGGNVVRFAGLYHGSRGAHTMFLKLGEVHRNGANVINLLHYEDAASLALAVRFFPPLRVGCNE